MLVILDTWEADIRGMGSLPWAKKFMRIPPSQQKKLGAGHLLSPLLLEA
jgi:hypothetical protein